MESLHARYPFLQAAREAVEEADVDLASIVTGGSDPIIERALDRLRHAIEDGTVGEPHPTPRVELLSYPVARVMVSAVDEPGLTRRYAYAEATTAFERFTADFERTVELRSVGRDRLSLDTLLDEIDVPAVSHGDDFAVPVATYLETASNLAGDRWRLVHREVTDGQVAVSRQELYELLREAIRARVESGLPLSVPDDIAAGIADPVEEVRERLADREIARGFDAVEPLLFPPCVTALLDRLNAEEPFESHSRFSLVAFLAAVGMPDQELVTRVGSHPDFGEGTVRSQLAYLRDDEGTASYPSPSCSTMQAYGDCVNQDALCQKIRHPLDYYERRLAGDDAVLDEDYASRPESQ